LFGRPVTVAFDQPPWILLIYRDLRLSSFKRLGRTLGNSGVQPNGRVFYDAEKLGILKGMHHRGYDMNPQIDE
jgi:hypothetical protein